MNRSLRFAAVLLSIAASSPLAAQTSYPMLMAVDPVAAQVGKSSEHTVKSRYSMLGAYEVFVSGTGVHGEIIHPELKPEDKLKPPTLETMKVRFNVDVDAMPGVRDYRIATPNGVSTVGQLVVVRDAVIEEDADNAAGQSIALPVVVCGRIEKAEDVDYFKFHVDAGTPLSFHVLCMRLQDRIHDLQQHADPMISIRNSMGSIVAASDNEFRGDPFINHKFAHSGDYVLEIRDVRYQGNTYWGYCIEINERPFVSSLYPFGLAAGATSQVQLVGFGLPEGSNSHVSLPKDIESGLAIWPVTTLENARQPMSIVVGESPIAIESLEPNESIDRAQVIALPGGVNGRIEAPGDIDYYAFEARKGDAYSIEVFASRAQSSLDSHLRILDVKGNQSQLSDDIRIGKRNYADSSIENWTVPADGKYFVELRDLHLRGGHAFTYFINASRSNPSFSLYADTDKTLLTPETAGVVFVRAERKNGANGEIQLRVDGLPDGVTASCGRILAGSGQDGCIVFQAAPDRKPVLANIRIGGTMRIDGQVSASSELCAKALVYQETYQPGGGRGHWPVDSHALSVGTPNDIRQISLSSYEISLKPGQSTRVDVEIARAEGFDKNVTLEVTFMHLNSVYGNSLPEGVSVDAPASNTLLTSGATKGHITLKAAPNAPPVEKQQIVVMANVSINFVMKTTYASRPVFVSVVK